MFPVGTGANQTTRTLQYGTTVTSNDPNYTTFQQTDPSDATHTDTLRVSKPGQQNTAIPLTYTTYAIQEIGSGLNTLERDYLVFGSQTPSVPTSGSATYNGIALATYNNISTGQTLQISGTSMLQADFAHSQITTTLSFTQQTGLLDPTLSGSGSITSANLGYQMKGTLNNAAQSGNGAFIGNFYGPNAEEFGYVFLYTNPNSRFNGLAVGKK